MNAHGFLFRSARQSSFEPDDTVAVRDSGVDILKLETVGLILTQLTVRIDSVDLTPFSLRCQESANPGINLVACCHYSSLYVRT